jgi:serine/threonine-protein kinase
MTQERAVALLGTELGLTVKILEEASDKAAGIVARQFPEAGQQVTEGSTVTLYVSDGSQIPKAEVPDVVGMFKGPAGIALGTAGFKVRVVEQPAEGYEPGTVIDQEPPAGTMLQTGSTVTIVVAVAPPTTTTTTSPTTTTSSSSTTTTSSSSTTTTTAG